MAAVVSLAVCLVAVRTGPALGMVDEPDDPALKRHRRPAVPLGGVAVLAGLVAGWLVAEGIDWKLIALATVVVLVGLADDRIGLAPGVRLVLEVMIGVAVVAMGLVPLEMTRPLEAIVAVVLVVLVINAVNLFDGLDGLAGTSGAVAFSGVAALAWMRGLDPTLGAVMAAALAGFLLLNYHLARVFLGDNGSYLVGFMLAVGVMRTSPGGLGATFWVSGLIFGVFALDLSVTVLRRRLAGRPMFAGDRSHLYDRLHDRGWSIPVLAVAAGAAQVGFVAVTLLADASGPNPVVVAMLAGVGLLTVVALATVGGRSSPQASG